MARVPDLGSCKRQDLVMVTIADLAAFASSQIFLERWTRVRRRLRVHDDERPPVSLDTLHDVGR